MDELLLPLSMKFFIRLIKNLITHQYLTSMWADFLMFHRTPSVFKVNHLAIFRIPTSCPRNLTKRQLTMIQMCLPQVEAKLKVAPFTTKVLTTSIITTCCSSIAVLHVSRRWLRCLPPMRKASSTLKIRVHSVEACLLRLQATTSHRWITNHSLM